MLVLRHSKPGDGILLPEERLTGGDAPMDGSYFQDCSNYNGVAFSIELLEWGRKFSAPKFGKG